MNALQMDIMRSAVRKMNYLFIGENNTSYDFIDCLCGLHNAGWIRVNGNHYIATNFGREQYNFKLERENQ